MAKKIFFMDTLTRYLVSFMSIWKNIYINTNFNGKQITYNVPVVFGAYNKYQELRTYIEERGKTYLTGYYNTPIISIRDDGFEFDTDRDPFNKNNLNIHYSQKNDINLKNRIPVPINYKFKMKIWVTYINHQSQIMEQLIPYIMRPFSLKLLEFPNITDIKRSVIVEVPSKSIDFNFNDDSDPKDANLKQRIMNIDFKIKGQMYYPVSKDEGFINKIKVKYQNGTTKQNFGTQEIEGFDEYIDYLELLKIKEIKENGGFESTNESGAVILNQYIRAEDYLYNDTNYDDILDLINSKDINTEHTDE